MDYRKLGNSDLEVSVVSFGCMSLKPDDSQAGKLIRKAVDSGINLFDTADLYDKGENEILLGKAVRDFRKDILISSKVGNQWRADGSGWDWNPSAGHILESIDLTLKRLKTDYLDLYLLHGGTIEDPADEAIAAFESLVKSGKIRAYGISSIRPEVIRLWSERSTMSAVMTQYSYLDRRPEEETLSLLLRSGIGVLARGTLAGGLLIDKPAKPYLDYETEEVSEIVSAFKKQTNTLSPTAAAIGFATGTKGATTAVVGIRSQEQLSRALEASSVTLTDTDRELLDRSVPANRYTSYR